MKKVLSRNENFGKTRYDNEDFTPKFILQNEEVNVPEDAEHFHRENEVHPRTDILVAPVRVYVDVTKGCTLSCTSCLNASGLVGLDELSSDQFVRVVEGLANDAVLDVRLTGGEPTMKDGWTDIVRAGHEAGLIVSMNTNGIFSERTLENVIDVAPDEVSVSVDGFGASNDRVRGNGTFDKAAYTVRALDEAGLRVTMNTLVSRRMTVDDAVKLVGLADEYCADVDFFPLRPFGRAQASGYELMMSFTELDKFMRNIETVKSKRTNVRTRSESLQRNAISDAARTGLSEGGSDLTRFNVMSNGDLYANGCALYIPGMKDALTLGNIVREGYSIARVWQSNSELNKWREWSGQLQKRCGECDEFKSRCGGFLIDMEVYASTGKRNKYCTVKRV